MIIENVTSLYLTLKMDTRQAMILATFLDWAVNENGSRELEASKLVAMALKQHSGMDLKLWEVTASIEQVAAALSRLAVPRPTFDDDEHAAQHEHDESCPMHPNNALDPKKVN